VNLTRTTGPIGEFTRTPDRKDFSLLPPQKTVLDQAKAAGMDVLAVGKISQIFAGSGITREITAHGNPEAIQATLQALQESFSGILMINLVDFDMLYGHRNNPQGFAQALQEVDSALSDILSLILPDDLLLITADHGCDPTTPSTDHSREYVPLLAYRPKVRGASLGIRSSFTDLGATVSDYLQLPSLLDGNSFLSRLTH
jgi:phosphopentomutase